MAAGDVTTVLKTIKLIGSEIRVIIDTGYRVSEKMKDSKQKLKQLDREQSFWETQIIKFDLNWDRDLLEIFLHATSQLEHEKQGLTKEINSRLLRKVKRAFFPSQVEQTIVRVDKIFENVLHELKRRTDITGELQKRARFKIPLLSFKEDSRYVRLEKTNSEVIAALGNVDGPPIVLLHGFSGTGKSSLARDVALQVQEAINRRHSEYAGFSQDSGLVEVSNLSIATNSSTKLTSAGSLMFEQVIFLECGTRVDLQAKQKELRDTLGWNPVYMSFEGRESESESDKTLMTVLGGLLKEKPLLIILDDVCKSTFDTPGGEARKSHFLQNMTDLGGKNVKWLVTSQEGDLCSVLNSSYKAIPMEHIKPEVARKILARQIGFPVDEIGEAAKMYMDRIIQKVDANPLAMTCISPRIDRDRFDDEREWEVAMKDLANLLGTKAETPIQSKGYGLSYWEAIKVGLDLLGMQHQSLLILMALCEGPSAPEEIVEYLFVQSTDPDSDRNFSSARRDLKGRQLITISVFKDRMRKEGKRWTLHDMIKEFIINEWILPKNHGKSSLIERLSKRGVKFKSDSCSVLESRVVSTLISLYFSERFRIEFEQFSSFKMENPAITRREVIEPLSRLLVLRENDKWTSTLHFYTRQIVLTYVRDGQFDEESILYLLESRHYGLRMIDALDKFARSREYSFVGEKVICALIRLLECALALNVNKEQELDYDLLVGVSRAVCRLVYFAKAEHRSSVTFLGGVSFSKAFTQIADLLMGATKEVHPRTREQLFQVVKNLASSQNIMHVELINTPGLLEGLVKASFIDDNRDLQATAINVLATLARRNDTFPLRVIDIPGMLDGLVKALAADDHRQLQREASALLGNFSRNDHTALRIVERPGAIGELVNGVRKVRNKVHQKRCAQALGYLASRVGKVKFKLLQFTEELVKDFLNNHNNDLQATALKVLAILAQENDSSRVQMVDVLGMLDGLVKALAADSHHELQKKASLLFQSLAFNDNAALKIVEWPGALDELANGLGKETNKRHQIRCAQALGNLASRAGSVKLRLLQSSKVIEGLVKASFEDNNHDLQAAAVEALGSLAIQNDSFQLQLVNVPGMLDGLVKALSANDHPRLQREASALLGNLSRNDRTALKIVEHRGAINELVNGLAKVSNKVHQKRCAQALGHLASRVDDVKARLFHFTEGLVKRFFNDHSKDLQATAANVLATLAEHNDSSRSQMADVPGLLDRLVKALTANDHHELQKKASLLFRSLSSNNHAALKIAECPGALHELVSGLGKATIKRHQIRSAQALGNLATCGGSVKLRLLQCPTVIDGLVKASLEVDNYDVRAVAIEALGSLAIQSDNFQSQIVDAPGMLSGLVKALTVNNHNKLQGEASGLLCHLAVNDQIVWKIVEHPGVLDKVMSGLGKEMNVLHQKHCAKALGNLALRDENAKVRLLRFTQGLIQEFFKDHDRDLQATTVNVLATLATENDSCRLQMVNAPGMMKRLVKALTSNDHHELQQKASILFVSLAFNDHAASKIVEFPGAVHELVNGLGNDANKLHQNHCAQALRRIASLGDDLRLRLTQFPKLTEELVRALTRDGVNRSSLRLAAGDALAQLVTGNHHIKSEMRNFRGLLEALTDAVGKDANSGAAVYILTALSPQRGREIHLSSGAAYSARGEAEAHLGLYREALEDLDEACRLGGSSYKTFGTRCYVKARLSKFEEALVDANLAVEKGRISRTLLDRGVLKRILGDFPGALEDLDKSLHMCYCDVPRRNYTRFKHRGFVKFLLGDEVGARADAESAMFCKPLAVDDPAYGTWTVAEGWSVEYLNFQLR